MSYEEIVTRLEIIAKQLESGQAPLSEAMTLFAESQTLKQEAERLLAQYEAQLNPPA